MFVAIDELLQFYRSPLGRISKRLLQEVMAQMIGGAAGQRVVGLGYCAPYLSRVTQQAERVMAFMPARQGAQVWPADQASCTALVDPSELPLTDSAVDLVIANHLFEFAREPEELMQELWRVTAPGARLVIVVPRRRGLWAQRDNTPFGHGHPFSRNQLHSLLQDHSFTPEVWREALYLPPSNFGPILKAARIFEGLGRFAGPAFAGALVVRARKEMFPAVTRKRRVRQVVKMPGFVPQPAYPVHSNTSQIVQLVKNRTD